MKRAIEFEQKITYRHRIVIECENEALLEAVSSLTGDSFDDILGQAYEMDGVTVLESSEEYSEDAEDGVEYYDDYWTKNEIKEYGESNQWEHKITN